MPAAELSRLRLQINQLILIFEQPVEFCRRLHDLLNHYANHAYRAGQAVQAQPILPSYRVPVLVTRQLEVELGKTCLEKPQAALALVDFLWKDAYLEPRLLATSLLGAVPVDAAGDGVIQKLRDWGKPEVNLRIFTALAENGTTKLRREAPEKLLDLIREWVESKDVQQQAVGVRTLLPLIEDSSFQNLPAVFRMLTPIMQKAQPPVQADLIADLKALIERSPVETSYFLRQTLAISSEQATARLTRRVLADFPPEQQESLRAALKAKSSF